MTTTVALERPGDNFGTEWLAAKFQRVLGPAHRHVKDHHVDVGETEGAAVVREFTASDGRTFFTARERLLGGCAGDTLLIEGTRLVASPLDAARSALAMLADWSRPDRVSTA